jgi:DNA mismatch repair protein MutL
MKKIHILAPEIAQKIAAGEVIERPVSVVKELVENSLDAGATDIRVELLDGGKRSIKVQDNGSGMSREDAALCFRRHSTSKIATEEDLERISTLGFRGEALASISAVSRLSLRTFDGAEERGTLIEREGEKLLAVTDIAFPRGTAVEVRDLFFNLPARRKFLRSSSSEFGLIAKYLTQAALSHPGVRFVLVHGTRETINCPPVGALRDRIFQLYGKDVVDGLMEVAGAEGEARLSGYSSRPLQGRADRSVQHFIVNNRPVKDRILQAALNQAYAGILERNRSAEAFLFITLPCGDVDVNVHPAKAEVRFRDSQLVFRLVLRAVEHGTLREHAVKDIYPAAAGVSTPPGVAEETVLLSGLEPGRRERAAGEGADPATGEPGLAAGPAAPPFSLPEKAGTGPEVLGQFQNLYIVASAEDGLLVIDQHNAHERVLFDKFREIDRRKLWPRETLLIPALLELSPSEAVAFEENTVLFEELGFRVEAMGGRSFALKEYPGVFRAEEAADVFLALLEEAGQASVRDRREKFLATLACKTAVKAGQPLTREKMGYLVDELFKSSQPALCPHGRPIVVKVGRSQIDKGMRR